MQRYSSISFQPRFASIFYVLLSAVRLPALFLAENLAVSFFLTTFAPVKDAAMVEW